MALLAKSAAIRRAMMLARIVRRLAATAIVIFCCSCEELETAHQVTTDAIASVIGPPPGYWIGDDVSGPPKIIVHLSEQKAYFYKGKYLVGESIVSTGKRGFSTPPGQYRVVSKNRDHISSVFGDYIDDAGNVIVTNIDVRKDPRPPGTHFDGARMPYCMHFNRGYAMHEGYVPPYAASHGCIRLPHGMAERFFDAVEEGSPIIVKE